ncbi:hypothetical protein OH77DRAFT_1428431 [Trametes cingulata]|nr:hypothetical protein OH77DRAFT_1428431 [Trametes cingulata]
MPRHPHALARAPTALPALSPVHRNGAHDRGRTRRACSLARMAAAVEGGRSEAPGGVLGDRVMVVGYGTPTLNSPQVRDHRAEEGDGGKRGGEAGWRRQAGMAAVPRWYRVVMGGSTTACTSPSSGIGRRLTLCAGEADAGAELGVAADLAVRAVVRANASTSSAISR